MPVGLHIFALLINAGPFCAWMTAWGLPPGSGWRVTSLLHADANVLYVYLPGRSVLCWLHFIGRTVVVAHLNKYQQGGSPGGLRQH